MADGMAALFIAAGLFLAAGTLAAQSVEMHQRATSRYQAAMIGRQAMEMWKAGMPLPDEVELAGDRYVIRYRQYDESTDFVVWEVEVSDKGGKPFSCRRLVPLSPKERLDDDGSAVSYDAGRPDLDGLLTPGQSDRTSR